MRPLIGSGPSTMKAWAVSATLLPQGVSGAFACQDPHELLTSAAQTLLAPSDAASTTLTWDELSDVFLAGILSCALAKLRCQMP